MVRTYYFLDTSYVTKSIEVIANSEEEARNKIYKNKEESSNIVEYDNIELELDYVSETRIIPKEITNNV